MYVPGKDRLGPVATLTGSSITVFSAASDTAAQVAAPVMAKTDTLLFGMTDSRISMLVGMLIGVAGLYIQVRRYLNDRAEQKLRMKKLLEAEDDCEE